MYISDYVSNSLIINQNNEWITYFVQRENKNLEYKKISSLLYIYFAWWNIHTLAIVFKCTRQTSYQYTEYLFLLKSKYMWLGKLNISDLWHLNTIVIQTQILILKLKEWTLLLHGNNMLDKDKKLARVPCWITIRYTDEVLEIKQSDYL